MAPWMSTRRRAGEEKNKKAVEAVLPVVAPVVLNNLVVVPVVVAVLLQLWVAVSQAVATKLMIFL